MSGTAPGPGTDAARRRDAARTDFLRAAGRGADRISPLAGDASNRSYLRLHSVGGPAVLMDAPPDRGEDVRPFVAVTGWLRSHGLSAPEIVAADPQMGFLLLEDMGDALYARVCADTPAAEPALYTAAVDLLAGLPPAPEAQVLPLAPYDEAVLLREARLAVAWYLTGAAGTDVPPSDLLAEFDALIAEAVAPVADARQAVVLRDYHAENLLWLPGREGAARVGLLDYQDALAGHPAYDLVSLLEDARRDTGPELRTAMLARYLAARPDLDPEPFRAACAVLGAQRNLKIVGIFARLCLRDGKQRYPALIPRVWAHLQRDLDHPGLERLRAWVHAHLPAPESAILGTITRQPGSRA